MERSGRITLSPGRGAGRTKHKELLGLGHCIRAALGGPQLRGLLALPVFT